MARFLWTPELCAQEALKYKSKSEFKRNSAAAYRMALKLSIMDVISQHMTRPSTAKIWSETEVLTISSKHKSRKSFKANDNAAYVAAKKMDILNKACAHMVSRGWTQEKIIKEALKYNTRHTFSVGSAGAYHAARKTGILDEVCAHMIVLMNNWDIDSITKAAKACKTRTEFQKEYGGAIHAAKQLGILEDICSHMPIPKRWKNKQLRQLALKYTTRAEFLKNHSGAYWSAKNRGIWDDICSHMVCGRRKWFIENIKDEISKYDSRADFKKGSLAAYQAAREMGVFYELTAHWPSNQRSTPWTKEEAIEVIKQYSSCKELREDNSGLYQWLKKNDLLDDLTQCLDKRKYLSNDDLYEIAKSYNKRRDFKIAEPTAYHACVDRGMLDDVCIHMKGKRTQWTHETCIAASKPFKYLVDFEREEGSALSYARRHNLMLQITEHMIPLKVMWNEDDAVKLAKEYDCHLTFKKEQGGAYSYLSKRGLYIEATAHMPKSRYARVTYIWKVKGFKNVWKIGVTSNMKRVVNRIDEVCRSNNLEIDNNEYYASIQRKPTKTEKAILQMGDKMEQPFTGQGFTEFRILTDTQVSIAKQMLSK